MSGLEIGFLIGLLLCVGLYGFLLLEFRKVYKQQQALAKDLAAWQQACIRLSDTLREDERVKMASVMLEEKPE